MTREVPEALALAGGLTFGTSVVPLDVGVSREVKLGKEPVHVCAGGGVLKQG